MRTLLTGTTWMMLAIVAVPTHAATIVVVGATSANDSVRQRSVDTPSVANANHISGRASAATNSDSTIVRGELPRCGEGPAPLAGCVLLRSPLEYGYGAAVASADGTRGMLRAGARALEDGAAGGRALAALADTLTVTSPIEITLVFDALRARGGSGTIDFRIYVPGTDIETDPDVDLFRLSAFRDDDGSEFFAEQFPFGGVGSPQAVPELFRYTLDLDALRFVNGRPSPPGLPFGVPASQTALNLVFELRATADCRTRDCSIEAFADQSLYLGLRGQSANGYQYLGFSPTSPPVNPVPEPATATLLLGSLAMLGLASGGRRRRAQPQTPDLGPATRGGLTHRADR